MVKNKNNDKKNITSGGYRGRPNGGGGRGVPTL